LVAENVTSSFSIRLAAWHNCPVIWSSMMPGLIACPASMAPYMRLAVIAPVSVSTSISATAAP
jgi:hypothetical protein